MLGDCVSSPEGIGIDALAPCTHEAADTRVFLHVAAATLAGHHRVIVHSSDSDVVVLATASFVALGQRIDELWIAFGVWRHFRYCTVISVRCVYAISPYFIMPMNNSFLFPLLGTFQHMP